MSTHCSTLGALAQCSDWQIDLLCFVATGIGPQISIKDLRVGAKGDLTLALQIAGVSQKDWCDSNSCGCLDTGWALAKLL